MQERVLAMDHVDIEVTDGSILIFTDEGDMLQMSVEPSSEGVIGVMSSRPPSSVTLSGAAADAELVAALEGMGHEVNGKESIESVH